MCHNVFLETNPNKLQKHPQVDKFRLNFLVFTIKYSEKSPGFSRIALKFLRVLDTDIRFEIWVKKYIILFSIIAKEFGIEQTMSINFSEQSKSSPCKYTFYERYDLHRLM